MSRLSLHHTIDIISVALSRSGKHKIGVGCLYTNNLEGVDRDVLQTINRSTLINTWQPSSGEYSLLGMLM
jgi:hypothetical protein